MRRKVEYLIVGQGLAGTFLAFQLLLRGKSFLVVDKGLHGSSSMVAAGIINPIVLKRLTITWRSREFLKYNPSFYKGMEELLGSKYHFLLPLEKLISTDEEKQFWKHRFNKEFLADLIEEELSVADQNLPLKKKYLLGRVKQSSRLDINSLLVDFRKYLLANDFLLDASFHFDSLSGNTYESIDFDHLVFCEGANGVNNPYFKDLPFALNKGQLMTIHAKGGSNKSILKKKVFVLPTQSNTFKVGATFAWSWKEDGEKEEEQSKLLKSQFEDFYAGSYDVRNIHVGIRPATRDRRPLIGRHHKNERYYIFNGMGSKGCLLAPLLTSELVDFIESGRPLHPEMDINRFYSKMNL